MVPTHGVQGPQPVVRDGTSGLCDLPSVGIVLGSRCRRAVGNVRWTDYRRGCRCGRCWIAHEEQLLEDPIALDVLPDKMAPEYTDPSEHLFNLL